MKGRPHQKHKGTEAPAEIAKGTACPVGQDACDLLEEVERLRQDCRRLMQLSITDPMTGFYNFRYLIQTMEREMERTRRTRLPMALIMIDLDHFKRVNDDYGHPVGDAALQWACHIWRENIRRIDIPCRYGGEEFVIVLPGTTLAQATMLAERLRRKLAALPLRSESYSVPLTASFGVSGYQGQEPCSPEMVIEAADKMLLRAKAEGRNRVCTEMKPAPAPVDEVTVDERAALFAEPEPTEPS
ncbi:MAG: GGDEF domain-containing protein [Syntrophobacteraceae bacterium]